MLLHLSYVLFLRAANFVDRPNTRVWIYLTKWNREMPMHACTLFPVTTCAYVHSRAGGRSSYIGQGKLNLSIIQLNNYVDSR